MAHLKYKLSASSIQKTFLFIEAKLHTSSFIHGNIKKHDLKTSLQYE